MPITTKTNIAGIVPTAKYLLIKSPMKYLNNI